MGPVRTFPPCLLPYLLPEGQGMAAWRGEDEEVIAVVLVVDGCLFFAVMAPISREQVTL